LPRCAGLCPAGIRIPATDPTFRRSCDGRMKDINPRLGRGLESLLGDPTSRAEKKPIGEISITAMEPSPFQPRGPIDPESLTELVDSIRARGLLQPLLVRPHPTQ